MTQIEQIKAEIERLKADYVPKVNTEYRDFAKLLLDIVVDSINSLPAEQPSERLGDEIDHFRYSDIFALAKRAGEEVTATAQYFAQWQKEQMMKSAIDAKIVNDEMSGCVVDCEQGCLVLEPNTYPIGQKLKILIIKEEEQ